MKKQMTTMLAAGLMLFTVSALSAGTTGGIAVLDMHQVMAKSQQIVKAKTAIQKTFEPRQKALVSAQKTLKTDVETLRRDSSVMKEGDAKALRDKIVAEQRDFQKLQVTFQRDLVTAQDAALKSFYDKVKTVVAKIAKDQGFSLVLTRNVTAYASDQLNITQRVIKALNR